jgi:hypothetical protein
VPAFFFSSVEIRKVKRCETLPGLQYFCAGLSVATVFKNSMTELLFALRGSVDAELKAFKALAKNDPEKSKMLYTNGEKLIILAANGEYAQFKRFVGQLSPGDIMSYFVAKSLMASLSGGHLMLSTFILDNGYPLQVEKGLPNILLDCVKELQDFECAPIVKLLCMKGSDVNRQVRVKS